jgi:hypothetical protein
MRQLGGFGAMFQILTKLKGKILLNEDGINHTDHRIG